MATKIRANPTLIGAFVLGALGLAAVVIIVLGGAALFTPKQRAVVFFEGSVNGLTVGAPVNFRGVNVGSVDKIALQFDAATLNARIPVYLTLLPRQINLVGSKGQLSGLPFEGLIEKGLRAKLNLQSFVTGQLTVDLDFKPEAPAVFMGSPEPGVPEIPATLSDFDAIKEQFSNIPFRQVADDVHRVVDAVREISDGTSSILKTMDAETKATSAEAQRTLRTATAALEQMQATLVSVKVTAEKSSATLDAVGPQFAATLKRADVAFDHADATLKRIDGTFDQLTELTAPAAPLRLELEQTLRDLSKTAESLSDLAETLERQPNALLFGKEEKRP